MHINGKYRLEADSYQVILVETYLGESRKGQAKDQERRTYHATTFQALKTILEREAGDADDIVDILTRVEAVKAEILAALDEQATPVRQQSTDGDG